MEESIIIHLKEVSKNGMTGPASEGILKCVLPQHRKSEPAQECD